MNRSLRVWILIGLSYGCAPRVPLEYARSSAAAERAYTAGRYEEAARYWELARTKGESPHDREEAVYREAQCFLRLGDYDRALPLLAEVEHDGGDRAPRAAYDSVVFRIERGESDASAELLRIAERYPDTGVARLALRRYLFWLRETQDSARVLSRLEALLPTLQSTALDQEIQYALAQALEAAGRLGAALARYLELARAHPYPEGAYWDDALWHASLLEEKTGNAKNAVAELRRMLRARESSDFLGSYERPRYDAAQLRIATLLRDDLDDAAGAEREFEKLWSDFPTSRLRDDALWQAARLKSMRNDGAGACAALIKLVRQLPDSRFAQCAYLLCPTVPRLGTPCEDYVARAAGLSLPATSP